MTDAPRRTQAERRTTTIGKLVEATIEAIAEVGYHHASLGEISRRAGISKGAIFRHFDSRTDLVVAAAEEVARRHTRAFDNLDHREPGVPAADLATMLRRARTQIRHETNTVWFELMVAARTEPELRERFTPVAHALVEEIERIAVSTLAGTVAPDQARLFGTSIVHMFDGEAIFRSIYPRPEAEEARIDAIADAVGHLTDTSNRMSPNV